MIDAVEVALDAVAVARLTRLLVEDVILDPIRDPIKAWASKRKPPLLGTADVVDTLRRPVAHPKIAYFLTCPWCVSVYVAAGAVVARRYAPRAWETVARASTFSFAAGWLLSH